MKMFVAGERAMLEGLLDVQRDEVARLFDESFVLESEDSVASVRRAFLAACEHSREVAAAHDLDEQFPWHHGPVTLRFVYGHMTAELARHAGHGDVLLEQLRADHRRPM